MMCACIAKERGIGRGSVNNSSPTQVLQRSRRLSKDEMILRLAMGRPLLLKPWGLFAWLLVVILGLIWKMFILCQYGYVYLMRYKSEAFGRFKEYRLEVENQTNSKIKVLRSDRGGLSDVRKKIAGYYFYDPTEQKVFVSRNTVFLEKDFPSDNRHDEVLIEESSEKLQHDSTTSFEPMVHTDSVPVLRRSTRESREPHRYGFVGLTSQFDNDLKTYGEAMSDIDSNKWLEAMKSEMDSMGLNQLGADGEVTGFKARLVAKEYTQRPGIDFEETYLPVAMAKSIRILLAIAAWYDYEILQMDVKTAFLNSFVEEEIFMDQPKGFTAVGEEQKVCLLQRSIYGLKQASQSWNTHFYEVIRGYDFIKNDYDPCVYKKISESSVSYLVLYVHDILLIGNDVKMLGNIKTWLST
ncbi:UNVERIFIED_CONTAM: Retrovirus-related Pol polyprotein from transposon RE2 [Sesamum radiatum]|uniref:Retrovirus-related Pol polyprotein from transposon RE2 n=1 Tax=Sesamum radiatum TaxID=300843 RepID=A0AAW2QHH6_SESRA